MAERRPRPRRSDAAANRERILEVAAAMVQREGIRFPMARLAEAAGVGIGTVYRHFPSREALMDALTERSFELVLANAREAAGRPGSAREAIGAYLTATIADHEQFVLPWHGGPSVRSARARELQGEVWRLVGAIVERGRSEGSVRPDLTAGDVIRFAAMLAQPLPNAPDWEQVAGRQAEIYLAGLRPSAS